MVKEDKVDTDIEVANKVEQTCESIFMEDATKEEVIA
jgi:hypothetical protein